MSGTFLALVALAGAGALAWVAISLEPARAWDLRPVAEDEAPPPPPGAWPSVAVLVPARNEAAVLEDVLPALLAQTYEGRWSAVLVDDRSDDGTGAIAGAAAARSESAGRLTVVSGAPLPPGWTGKVWALEQALATATAEASPAYVLLTDADIRHAPHSLRLLVAEAEASGLALNSRMARLRCESTAERLLVPPFLLFFNLLYPMRRVNDGRSRVAAAAGGCVLLRTDALAAAGGFRAIRGAIIDDVKLARAVKRTGAPIRLAASRSDVCSVRSYRTLRPIWRMVRRSAFDELGYSWLRLAGTTAAMLLLFPLPPLLAGLGLGLALAGATGAIDVSPTLPALAAGLATAALAMMAAVYRPAVRFFELPARWLVTLPLSGTIYGTITLDSARVHALRRRGW